jgi:hypothetical protein
VEDPAPAAGHVDPGPDRRACLLIAGTAILFGVIEAGSTAQMIATIPEFFWELSLGIWLLVRGFNPAALAKLNERQP